MRFNSWKSGDENRYLFHNGTEWEPEVGWYHFKYRMHDPALGRFFVIDPLAEQYAYNSPYAFAENKLGRGIELEGAELLPFPWLGAGVAAARPTPIVRPVAASSSKWHWHHIVPRGLRTSKTVRQARKGDFKFEGKENKMQLERYSKETGEGRHGSHPNYNQEVGKRISEFEKANEGQMTPEQATNFLRNTVKDLKNIIENNPDTKINDLFQMMSGMGIDITIVESDGTKSSNNNRAMTSDELQQNREDAEQQNQQQEREPWQDECDNLPDCI